MDVFGKSLALVFSLLILAQAYLVRRVVGTWLFPACLFGLFWFGYTFVPLAVLFAVPAEPYAIAFIFLCTAAFSIGSLPFDWRTAFESNARKRETAALVYGTPFLKGAFCLATLGSLVFLALNLVDQGISLHDFVSDLYGSAAAYANLLYSETLNINNFDRLNILCAHVGAILGGLLFPWVQTKSGRGLIVGMSFLPSILVAVTESGKGLLFFCIALFYAGLLVNRASAGTLRLFESGSLKSLVLYTAIVIPIVTIAFLARGLYTTGDRGILINRLMAYYASYAFGHVYAFADWFSFVIGGHSTLVYPSDGPAYGFYTFTALFKLLGSDKVVPQGVYDQYYSHGDLLTTNIFTMFRGLILDFGFVGSVLFMIGTGFLFHLAFHIMLRNRRPVFSVAVFVFMIAYFYNSFIISALGWNRVYVAFMLLWIVLQINKLIAQMGHRSWASAQQPAIT